LLFVKNHELNIDDYLNGFIFLFKLQAVSYGSEDGDDSCVQNPEKLISFGTFVNILVILACNLYTQEESYVHEKITKSKPSDALLCLLTQAIISNACKLSGVIYQDNEKSKEIHVFLQPLYQAYKFLVRIKRKVRKICLELLLEKINLYLVNHVSSWILSHSLIYKNDFSMN
ncbi:unnamed protein product, partial [Schistosoma mattheei]